MEKIVAWADYLRGDQEKDIGYSGAAILESKMSEAKNVENEIRLLGRIHVQRAIYSSGGAVSIGNQDSEILAAIS